jgi:hypothetical protein
MNQTTKSINLNDLAMQEKYIDIHFSCALNGIVVYVDGNYHVGLNVLNPTDINGQSFEEFAEENNFDESDLRIEVSEFFENR